MKIIATVYVNGEKGYRIFFENVSCGETLLRVKGGGSDGRISRPDLRSSSNARQPPSALSSSFSPFRPKIETWFCTA